MFGTFKTGVCSSTYLLYIAVQISVGDYEWNEQQGNVGYESWGDNGCRWRWHSTFSWQSTRQTTTGGGSICQPSRQNVRVIVLWDPMMMPLIYLARLSQLSQMCQLSGVWIQLYFMCVQLFTFVPCAISCSAWRQGKRTAAIVVATNWWKQKTKLKEMIAKELVLTQMDLHYSLEELCKPCQFNRRVRGYGQPVQGLVNHEVLCVNLSFVSNLCLNSFIYLVSFIMWVSFFSNVINLSCVSQLSQLCFLCVSIVSIMFFLLSWVSFMCVQACDVSYLIY